MAFFSSQVLRFGFVFRQSFGGVDRSPNISNCVYDPIFRRPAKVLVYTVSASVND